MYKCVSPSSGTSSGRARLGSSSSSKSKLSPLTTDGAEEPVTVPLSLAGVPEEWLAYPKQVSRVRLVKIITWALYLANGIDRVSISLG